MVQYQTPAPQQSLMRYQTPYANRFSGEEIRAQQSLQPANVRRSIRFKTAIASAVRNNYRDLTLSVLPIGFAGKAGKLGSGLKNIFGRATTNPFAGMSLKEFGTKALGKVAGIYSLATGFELVRSAQAGDKFNPLGLKTLQTAGGFALSNPIVGGLGIATGIGQRSLNTAKQNMSMLSEIPKNIVPTVSFAPSFNAPEIPQFQTPSFPAVMTPAVSSNYTAPGVYVSGGGGGGGLGMEALLLLLAGVGGYAIGRKRKKKKKKKSKKGKR